jgi:hypothetical protein
MKKKIRYFFIKQGLLKPKSLKESREIFTFPVDTKEIKSNPIWMSQHIEPMHYIPNKSYNH